MYAEMLVHVIDPFQDAVIAHAMAFMLRDSHDMTLAQGSCS